MTEVSDLIAKINALPDEKKTHALEVLAKSESTEPEVVAAKEHFLVEHEGEVIPAVVPEDEKPKFSISW